MRKNLFIFLMILLTGYMLRTTSFAATNTVNFSCDLGTTLNKSITIGASSNITVNWGDGVVQEIPVVLVDDYGEGVLNHTYTSANKYNISVTANNIKKIVAKNNDLLSINVSNASLLKTLYIDNNKINNLDLSNNMDLRNLSCADNNLSQLKVWSSNIENLNCNNNKIATLDIPNSITELHINNNNLSTLNISTFANLVCLECAGNSIENLVVGASSDLEKLDFSNNLISNISLTNNIAIKELYCSGNKIKVLNLSNNINIEKVNCAYNQMETLTLNNNTKLKELYIFKNDSLSSVDLKNLDLEVLILDKDISINNNSSQCTIKLNMTGNGGIIIGNNKKIIFPVIPKSVFVDGEKLAFGNYFLDISEYTGEKNITINFYELVDDNDFSINEPQLIEGMIPVKYDGTNWIITNAKDKEWYNYKNKKWANVMLRDNAKYLDVDGITLKNVGDTSLDNLIGREVPEANTGSMYVWVPRFSFRIGENVDIKFSQGLVDDTTNDYILHPAFNYANYRGGDTSNSNNYESLTSQDQYLGMWVAKYSAGGDLSSPKYASNAEKIENINIGQAFLKAKLTGTSATYKLQNAKSHMIKNTEWGAVAYLTSAIGDMRDDSTTGNKYGIFNMNNSREYVSTFIELIGGISNFSVRVNGKNLIPYTMLKYAYTPALESKDIELIRLRKAQDNETLNYNIFSKYYGIAMNEISENISGDITKTIPHEHYSFLVRGIDGIYSYSGFTGASDPSIGFRNVIFGTGINNNDNNQYFTITSASINGEKIIPYGSMTVKEGKNIVYSIRPNSGYELIDVIVDGNSEYYGSNYIDYGTYSTYEFNNVTSNHSIIAEFDNQIQPYNVSAEKYIKNSGQNDSIAEIQGEGLHNSRSIVTLKAIPIAGYKIVSWEAPSDLSVLESSSPEEFKFRMPNKDVVIKAIFEEISEVQLIVENKYSSLRTEKSVGALVQVVAGEIDNYKFHNWTVEGIELTEEQKSSPSVSFTMPPNKVELFANYNGVHTVRIVLQDSTQIEFEGEVTNNIVFATPNQLNDQSFVGWKINGEEYLDLENGIELEMPDEPVDIETIYQ